MYEVPYLCGLFHAHYKPNTGMYTAAQWTFQLSHMSSVTSSKICGNVRALPGFPSLEREHYELLKYM